jgi:hypothetical protein
MGQGDPSLSVGSDDELFSAARTGSKTALGQLLEECRYYLLLIANRELGEGVRAKLRASNLVPETFAEAQRIFDRFEGESSQEMPAWFVSISLETLSPETSGPKSRGGSHCWGRRCAREQQRARLYKQPSSGCRRIISWRSR